MADGTHTDWRPRQAGTRLVSLMIDAQVTRRQVMLWVVTGVAVEIAVMALLGLLGTPRVVGLPGPLGVAVAGFVGIFCGVEASIVVAVVAVLAYFVFLGHFGEAIHPAVIAAAGTLWVIMSVLVARGGGSLRRHVVARLRAQEHSETLYRDLERSLLPATVVRHPRLGVASLYVPGERDLRLGGDFFDLAVLADGSLALVIGDVSGHGPRAAALGAMLRGAWRGVVTEASPAATAHTLHRIALAEGAPSGVFATALFAWIDAEGATLRLISAGHPPPLLLASQATEVTVDPFLPLGVSENAPRWHVTTVPLPAEWTLFFYTDGITDMRRRPEAPERVGVGGLTARLLAMDCALTDAALQELVADIAAESGEVPPDDVAAVAVSKAPLPERRVQVWKSKEAPAAAEPADVPAAATVNHRPVA